MALRSADRECLPYRLRRNLATGGEPRSNDVFYDFLLAVNGYPFTVRQFVEVYAMRAVAKTNLEAVMLHAFPLQPFAEPNFA